MEEQRKEYTGTWIPRVVMEDERLSSSEKILYAEIACYDECFTSNAFLAKRIGLSETRVTRFISRLKDFGYVNQTSFDGRKRFLKAFTTMVPSQKRQPSLVENDYPDQSKMTTIDNNVNNNERTDTHTVASAPVRFAKPSVEEVKAYCSERKNLVNPEAFVDFYDSKGWKIGSQSMKDWKAAVRTWERRDSPAAKTVPTMINYNNYA